jgi:hypothetical protein
MPHTVRLRTKVLEKAMALARIPSDCALAKAMQVNRSTVTRVRTGELQPGSVFIGSVLTALTPLTFDDLFEIVPHESDTRSPA